MSARQMTPDCNCEKCDCDTFEECENHCECKYCACGRKNTGHGITME